MVGLLDRLETRNLVSRTRSEKDRRVVHINLTEQGRDLVRNSPEVVQSLLVKGLETHTAQKLMKISEELNEVTKILGVQEMPPKLIMSPEINMPKAKKRVAIIL
jgi:DNA-binding MarR family transcriptional regulator